MNKKILYLNQELVPDLPIPSLEETQNTFLKWCEPFLSEEEFKNTKKISNHFFENDGKKRQEKLLKFKESIGKKSWLIDNWHKYAYLSVREPIVYSGNFGMKFKKLTNSDSYTQEQYSGILIFKVAELYKEIALETLTPIVEKGNTICMKQVKGVFGSSRIPGKDFDDFRIYKPFEEVHSVGIFYKNNFYTIRIFDENQNIIELSKIIANIREIKKISTPELQPTFSVIPFAGGNKATELIEILSLDKNNISNLESLNKTIFNLSLYDEKETENYNDSIQNILYTNAKNVWIYKPWSFSIFKENTLCINYEHTYIDGFTNMYLIDYIIKGIENFNSSFKVVDNSNFITYKWNYSSLLKKEFKLIYNNYILDKQKFEHSYFEIRELNLENFINNKISLDTIIQTSFQYGYYKTYNKIDSIYESVNLSNFYEGRTECLRPVSKESILFVKKLLLNNATMEDLILVNIEHKKRIKLTKTAHGVMRHLMGLKLIEKESSDFFSDLGFLKLSNDQISTSTLGNTFNYINAFTFAPVIQDGIGIGYSIDKEKVILYLSFYKKNEKDITIFTENIREFFTKIKLF